MKLSPLMRSLLLELRSGRRCQVERYRGTGYKWRPERFSLEPLPAVGIPRVLVPKPTVWALESRGLVLITPAGVILKELSTLIDGVVRIFNALGYDVVFTAIKANSRGTISLAA